MNEISKRLHDIIIARKYSYGELAKQTGIPKSAIQRYATGKTEKIPLDRLELMARALGVSSAFLMGWESSRPTQTKNAELIKKSNPLPDDEDELNEYLEMLRTRPECRMLLKTMRGATKAEVEENVRFIEALRRARHEEGN